MGWGCIIWRMWRGWRGCDGGLLHQVTGRTYFIFSSGFILTHLVSSCFIFEFIVFTLSIGKIMSTTIPYISITILHSGFLWFPFLCVEFGHPLCTT